MTNHHHDDHPPSAERPLSRTTIRVVIAGGAYAGALILAIQAHASAGARGRRRDCGRRGPPAFRRASWLWRWRCGRLRGCGIRRAGAWRRRRAVALVAGILYGPPLVTPAARKGWPARCAGLTGWALAAGVAAFSADSVDIQAQSPRPRTRRVGGHFGRLLLLDW